MEVAAAATPVAAPVAPAAAAEVAEAVNMEEGFTENVASVLDQPIEAPKTVVAAPPAIAPVAPTPAQDIPVQFEEKK